MIKLKNVARFDRDWDNCKIIRYTKILFLSSIISVNYSQSKIFKNTLKTIHRHRQRSVYRNIVYT